MGTAIVVLGTADKKRLKGLMTNVDDGLESFIKVGNSLAEIRDDRLYEGCETFEAFCKKHWGFTDRRARQLIDGAKAAVVIESTGTIVPVNNEAQARILAELPTEQQQATVWVKAVETAPKDAEGNPKITAAHVKKVAAEVTGKKPPKKPKTAPEVETNADGDELVPIRPKKETETDDEGGYEKHEAAKPLKKLEDAIAKLARDPMAQVAKIMGKDSVTGIRLGLDAAYKAVKALQKQARAK